MRQYHTLLIQADQFTCSTREMRINYLLRVGIQIYEHTQYEFSGGYGISLGSCGDQTSEWGGFIGRTVLAYHYTTYNEAHRALSCLA